MKQFLPTTILAGLACITGAWSSTQNESADHGPSTITERPRILITTDIGGTDPDDNQSMMHFLLYSNEFDCEGIISSPSYGDGNAEEIIRMIGLYEQDIPTLKQHADGWPEPDYLRSESRASSLWIDGEEQSPPKKSISSLPY